jgi:arylsulfatase A-like enzyme
MVSIVDIYATVADMVTGKPVHVADAEDSSSFAATLFGKKQESRNPMVGTNAGGIQAIRSGKWKYTDGVFPDSTPENLLRAFKKEAVPALYDLENDPSEKENKIDKYPEVAEKLGKVLLNYRAGKGSR